jgi:ribosomal protein S18 acetylase RimI-like enzyme
MPELTVRPAVPQDGEHIAALMRGSVSDAVRRITIMCSPLLGRFVADELAAGTAQEYVIAALGGTVVGACAWRHTDRSLQLDHLYVAPEVRGQGIGSALVLDGLHRIRRPDEHELRLDVFDDTPRAVQWYRSWKMEPAQQTAWFELPLRAAGPCAPGARTSGWDEAEDRHRRYGFSTFTISTGQAVYRIGRLGEELFRCGAFGILEDAAALEELARLDPRRHLLCVGPASEVPTAAFPSGWIVARSERLTAPCEAVSAHLHSSAARRRL